MAKLAKDYVQPIEFGPEFVAVYEKQIAAYKAFNERPDVIAYKAEQKAFFETMSHLATSVYRDSGICEASEAADVSWGKGGKVGVAVVAAKSGGTKSNKSKLTLADIAAARGKTLKATPITEPMLVAKGDTLADAEQKAREARETKEKNKKRA